MKNEVFLNIQKIFSGKERSKYFSIKFSLKIFLKKLKLCPNPLNKASQVDHEERKKDFECEIKKLIINQAMCVKIIGLLEVVKRSSC